MANMHAGTISDDMSTAVVSSTSDASAADTTWGKTASDPYVIATIEDWETFVIKIAKDSNKGKGQYFVLANDLDFSALPSTVSQFHMAAYFQGTFYGLGHSLSNIDCTNWVAYDSSTAAYAAVSTSKNYSDGGFGIFGRIVNAVVADLVVENFSYTNVQQVTSLNGNWRGSSIGGVVGVSYGASFILNCQTDGVIEHLSFTNNGGNTFGWPAGIVGCSADTLYIYRCSAEVEISAPCASNFHPDAAGIIGEVWNTATCYVYDCAANATVRDASAGVYSHIGACIGWGNGRIHIENFVGSLASTPDVVRPSSGALGGSGNSSSIKNIYVDGKQGSLSLGFWTVGATFANTNNVLSSSSYHGRYSGSWTQAQNTLTSRASLLAAAKAAVGAASKLPAAIWDASKVDAASYEPANSPVRHFIKTAVKYYNYTTSAETQYEYPSAGKTDAVEVKAGNNLYVPANLDENREFVGWTTNKNLTVDQVSDYSVFKTVPFHLLGENKLYAVWKAKDVSLGILPTGNGMTTNAETGAKELVYDGAGITLSADLRVVGIDDPDCAYQWSKDGEEIKVGGTGDSYTVKNVDDSGKYTVAVNYRSKTEPLYFGKIVCPDRDAVTATIKPAPLTCTNVTFKPDTEEEEGEHAYSGAPYSSATPIPVVYNAADERVEGTAKWSVNMGHFNDPDASEVVQRGDKLYEKLTVIFEPDEKYGGNYGRSVRFDVEVEIEYLTFTFSIPTYDELELSFNLEYGNNYTFNNVADKFEELFKPYMGDKKLNGYSPAFVVNEGEEPVKINEYRKMSFNGQTTAYASVTSNRTLEVVFEYQTYTVKYDSRNGLSDYYVVVNGVGHNLRLQSPENPENGTKLFLGWYYELVDGDTGDKTEKQWDFSSDRVTRELELYAKWLEANTLVGIEVSFTEDAEFNALESVNPDHLIVTATFTGTDGTTEVERKTIIPFGGLNGYSIEYSRAGGKLHVNVGTDEAGNVTKTDTITVKYTFRKGATVQTKDVPVTLTVKPKLLDTDILKPYFKPGFAVFDGTAKSIKINTNVNGKIRQINDDEIEYVYYKENGDPVDADQVIDRGVYSVYAIFSVDDDYEAPSIMTTLEIGSQPVTLTISWGETTFVYNGKVQLPTPTFTDPDGRTLDPNYHLLDADGYGPDDFSEEEWESYKGDLKATDANKSGQYYTVSIVFDDHGYTADATAMTVHFQILKATVKKPTQTSAFEYRGEEYDLNNLDPEDYETYFEGFDPAIMEAISGDKTAIDAGTYGVTIKLKNPSCAEWEGGGSASIDVEWKIKKAVLRVSWEGSTELVYTGNIQVPKVNSLYTVYERDKNDVDVEGDLVVTGDVNAHEVGEYRISVSFRSGLQWTKNYELNDTRSRSFSIIPDGVEIVFVKWDKATVFEYNGAPQKPNYILTWGTADGLPLSEDEVRELDRFIEFNQEALKSKYAGNYTAEISLSDAGQARYYLKGERSCPYTITLNEAGEGADPNADKPGTEGPGNTGDPNNPNTLELPLWQLIVGGLSAVLFVFCTLKSFGEYGKLKAAKREAKELASQSYYSFAPLPLLAMGAGVKFLGLEETPWTIIALVALGLFVISAVMLFVLSKKRKAAELTVKREEARIAEEKEYAREEEQLRREEQMREEQRRRDEEMKMMFAAMQQGGGFGQAPAFGYEDMQNMITSAVSALLPAVQQQMALPPAQSDTSGYAQPGYVSPEAEMLRAQMAQQQELMAQQQAQMAQQQELINQLLQDRQTPAYEEEEEVEDDISWLGESDEIVSLEESYGALSDEGKRAYYEIGSYIMSKPRTSQNDGRYAVLFKYRRRTLFKLAIKDDAPVLYYPAGSGRGEVRIADEASLNVARSIIDQSVAMVDGQLD